MADATKASSPSPAAAAFSMQGHWGHATSDYNFCEVDYAVTYFVAEFFSAMSSIPIALYGIYYLQQTLLHGHGWRIALSSFGVVVIGVGSFAFHGTLQREGQMLDELPMLWSAVFFLFTALTLGEPPGGSRRSNLIGLGLITYACVNSVVYFAGGFVYFILAYIVAVVCVFASTVRHMLLPENRDAHPLMRAFAYRAMGFYAGGFLLFWLPEQFLCGNQLLPHHERGPIQALTDLPVPLHAFFHFTSALGPYYWLAFAAYSRLAAMGRKSRVSYPRNGLSLGYPLPVVRAEAV